VAACGSRIRQGATRWHRIPTTTPFRRQVASYDEDMFTDTVGLPDGVAAKPWAIDVIDTEEVAPPSGRPLHCPLKLPFGMRRTQSPDSLQQGGVFFSSWMGNNRIRFHGVYWKLLASKGFLDCSCPAYLLLQSQNPATHLLPGFVLADDWNIPTISAGNAVAPPTLVDQDKVLRPRRRAGVLRWHC